MNVESILSEELREVAGAVQPPPPQVADLVRIAERSRTRARARLVAVGGLVAAAVITAVLLGTQLARPSSAPPTHPGIPTPLPTGAPPAVPFVVGTILYVHDRAQPGTYNEVLTAGRTSVGCQPNDVVIFRDGAEVGRLAHTACAVLSPDGTKLAALVHEGGSFSLVEHDVTSGQDVGRLPVDKALMGHVGVETEYWEGLEAVTDDGTVIYGGVHVNHEWKPGTAPTNISPSVNLTTPVGFPAGVIDPLLNPDGTWGAWITDRQGRTLDEQPAGAPTHEDGLTLQRPGLAGTRFTLALPTTLYAFQTVWESSAAVIVEYARNDSGDPPYGFLRCVIATRRCEVAPTPGQP